MFPILLLAMTTTFTPARPAVGDPITIDFPAPVVVQPSPDYEIISRAPRRAIVRTFQPKPFVVHTSGGDVVIPVRSVLRPNDRLDPAPLKPPRPDPFPRAPFVAIGIAAAAAIAAWAAVVILARRRMARPEVVLTPEERFRATVEALRANPCVPKRWAQLADATRAYLADVDPKLGMELTTTEVLMEAPHPTIAEILRLGDLEKFSPWGAPPADFDAVADRALALIPEPVEEEAAA